MDIDFELLMANIRNQVNDYIDNVILKCCKEYNLPFHDVRQKLGLSEKGVPEKEEVSVVCENTVSTNSKSTKKTKNTIMCAALTRNGDPCKSKATENETYCKKHLGSANKNKEPVSKTHSQNPKTKKKKQSSPMEVTVNDLPNDEAEWLVNNQVGTIPPDLSMTKSFYPSNELIYDDDTVIDDVSESEYVLDE
jgi:hypothetical protein